MKSQDLVGLCPPSIVAFTNASALYEKRGKGRGESVFLPMPVILVCLMRLSIGAYISAPMITQEEKKKKGGEKGRGRSCQGPRIDSDMLDSSLLIF